MKGGALSLNPRKTNAQVDFAVDHACSSLGIGFGFEGFALGWVALTADLRSPLILAAVPDCCHFDHSRHVQVWQICGKNDFRD